MTKFSKDQTTLGNKDRLEKDKANLGNKAGLGSKVPPAGSNIPQNKDRMGGIGGRTDQNKWDKDKR